jgi:hypothetical protein
VCQLELIDLALHRSDHTVFRAGFIPQVFLQSVDIPPGLV